MPRLAYIAILALAFAALGQANVQAACRVELQVQNNSSFRVLDVEYRAKGSVAWSHTSISNGAMLEPSDRRVIRLPADGSYEIEIFSANAPNHPNILPVPDACTVSQVSVTNSKVIIQ